MALTLGIDVGTQGTKGIVLDSDLAGSESGAVVARASSSYGLIEGLPQGHAEQDPRTWVDAVRAVCGELASSVDMSLIEAVSFSGQQHGLVVLDEAGEVIRPAKLWCDTSTTRESAELSERLGRAIPTGFTAPKIAWLKRNEPASWERTRKVMLPHDYMNWCATGTFVMEAGDASGTGLLDIQTRAFDAVAVDSIDSRLHSCLPPLAEAGSIAGRVHDTGAAWMGVASGIPVATGGGDNMMSAIGSGATSPGSVVVSLGTSGTVFTHSTQPVVDPDGAIAGFCDSVGGWLPLLCVMNLTGITEEVVSAFESDHASLTKAAAHVAAGCDGLLLLPYLNGERVPDLPDAAGSLHGIRPGDLRAGKLYRAAMEGTSLSLGWGVERMRRMGIGVDSVGIVGGAAKNELWRRILASVLDAPVTMLAESESAALGAAIQALWTLRRAAGEDVPADEVAQPFIRTVGKVTHPDAEWTKVYRASMERLIELTNTLHA
ncbi:MAG: xylulokinase [Planctomycetota bacterium]|jgi:xylulokinase